jgi:hypothetical protein
MKYERCLTCGETRAENRGPDWPDWCTRCQSDTDGIPWTYQLDRAMEMLEGVYRHNKDLLEFIDARQPKIEIKWPGGHVSGSITPDDLRQAYELGLRWNRFPLKPKAEPATPKGLFG